MDPISLILTALAAGASSALKDAAGQAVKDTYSALKSLVRRKLQGDEIAEAQLDEIEGKDAPKLAALKPHLEAVGADRDEELVQLARDLMERLDPEGTQAGKYRVKITGGNVGAVGDNASVNMTFRD